MEKVVFSLALGHQHQHGNRGIHADKQHDNFFGNNEIETRQKVKQR